MRKLNMNIKIGISVIAVTIILSHLTNLPDFICGFGYGIGIGLELIGIYSMNHDITKIKSFKTKLFKKYFK